MKFVKEIAGRVMAVWAILLFAVTMLLFLIPFLLFCQTAKDPLRTSRFIRYSRIWMAVFLTLIGCPLRISGKKNFREGKNYIVLCNHNSLMDVPVSSPSIPAGNKTIAKKEFASIPLFGLLYRTGSVLVDRKSDASRKESYQKMKAVLDMGLHMCIYPEGTRNKTNAPLKSFHNGAFRLAIETGKPIIPAIITGSRKALPPDKTFFLWPQRLAIHFLAPVYTMPGESAVTLKERVFDIMETYYREYGQ